jgi:predicted carbohydrate-binding protein with CBM5 and CBM33 domain
MRIKQIVAVALVAMLSATVFAHGLMESPASRNWICGAVTKPDQVANGTAQTPVCGDAFAVNSIAGYSFMSVLTHNLGRSSVTPLPTNVCSFDSETWKGAVTPWDMPIDWPTNPMAAGEQTITWNISWGPHFDDTAEFRYWITKPSFQFSKTKALTWDDFEATPFCVLNYEDSTPNANPNVTADKAAQKFHTKCTIPARSGHHVIYGEWGRKPPTLERFHGCIDAAFGGVVNPEIPAAQIAATPANLNVTGATTIALSGAASQGTNLSYQWAVESANTSLYSFSSTTAASTTLTLKNPQALTTFTVRLTVSNGSNSNSASITFNHSPSAASNWQDFGALTSTAKSLAVGDKVSVRMVNAAGVDTYFPSTPLTITAANAGESAWTYALAQQINAANGDVQVGVLNSSDSVVPAQNATANRIYAKAPSTYVSAFLQVVGATTSSASSSSSKTSSSVSSVSSSIASSLSGQQCNWYGTLYPLCVTTASGWGWENNRNCIAASTCSAQPAPYGIVGGGSSAATSNSTSAVSSSRSSSSTGTSVATSSSVKTSSSSSVKTSSSSSIATSSSMGNSSSSASTGSNCSYVITNQWSNGFTAAIRIKNNRNTAINGWTVNWSYTDGSSITSGWNATVAGSNPYSATNLSWNAAIQPGQTVEFGVQGTKTAASASLPVVSGAACN